jgi:hypothetical protein
VCQAVRAPGAKWTLLAFRLDPSDASDTVSTWTLPVNQSLGPTVVAMPFRVIFMRVP